jgi:probable phosphoglycerate mutase
MTFLAVLRHGPTRWNAAGRIQGRTDVSLSPEGRVEVSRWRLPDDFRFDACHVSPLLRAVETARLLGAIELRFEPALAEMRWGEWEGRLLADIRAADPEGVASIEARGLDFAAPWGESPRAVQARLMPWLEAVAREGKPVIAVSHKGIVRALHAMATGWPMLGRPPDRLDWSSLHVFDLAADGTPRVERLNLPLRAADEGAPCPPRLF